MASDLSLHQRRRAPTADELAGIPWLPLLLPGDRNHAVAQLMMGDALPGDHVCRVGKPVTYWFGVVEGLLKMSSDNAQGQTMTFTGVPPGGWFGEGTAMKRAAWPPCSTRCSTPVWARCCASPSRSWPTWWACRASG